MPLPARVLLNGYYYSHASHKIRVLGLLLEGCKDATWKCSVASSEIRGTAIEPLGHTVGDAAFEFSMTIYRPYWQALKERIRTTYGRAPMMAQGEVVIVAAERGLPSINMVAKINGIQDYEGGTTQGTDASEVKLTFKVLSILEDGKPLVERSLHG